MLYFLCFVLFAVGLYGILVKKNIIKLIISVLIINYAIHFFLILCGYRWKGQAPILAQNNTMNAVDPLPQVLVMISIMSGAAVTALLVTIALCLYREFGTFDIRKMNDLKG